MSRTEEAEEMEEEEQKLENRIRSRDEYLLVAINFDA